MRAGRQDQEMREFKIPKRARLAKTNLTAPSLAGLVEKRFGQNLHLSPEYWSKRTCFGSALRTFDPIIFRCPLKKILLPEYWSIKEDLALGKDTFVGIIL